MTVVGIAMVKNEEDVIYHTITHMLQQVDYVIVADNLSTDNTRIILEKIRRDTTRLLVFTVNEPGYFQSRKMTDLAHLARSECGGSCWIVPFDADEWWDASDSNLTVREVLEGWTQEDRMVANVPLVDYVPTPLDDPSDPNPYSRMKYRKDSMGYLPKVACKAAHDLVIEPGNHSAHYSSEWVVRTGGLLIRHFPVRSSAQFISKAKHGAAAYKAAGSSIPETYGAHWRRWGRVLDTEGEEGLLSIYNSEHLRTDVENLVFDPLLKEHT